MEKNNKLIKPENRIKIPGGWLKWVLMAFLVIYAISLIFPFVWALITSAKTYEDFEIFENKIGLPEVWTFDNFKSAWQNGGAPIMVDGMVLPDQTENIPMQFVNSLIYSLGCAIAATLTPCIAAYAVARFKYKLGNLVYGIVIFAMILPVVGSLPSEIQMTKALGIYDTFWGLWLMKANFLGIYFLVMYAQFAMIPKAYTEAARVDGASNFRIMVQVIFPLASSTIFTVLLLNFVQFWNDYQIPMVYLPSKPVAAYGMYAFSQKLDTLIANTPTQIAYMIVVSIPILVVFLIFHKKLMGNIAVGGIKG